MKCGWREGNQIQLLENGDQFYPAVFEAIAQAQQKSFWKPLSCLKMRWVKTPYRSAKSRTARRKSQYYSTATALPISATRLSAN